MNFHATTTLISADRQHRRRLDRGGDQLSKRSARRQPDGLLDIELTMIALDDGPG
jgi:hypothetical protein